MFELQINESSCQAVIDGNKISLKDKFEMYIVLKYGLLLILIIHIQIQRKFIKLSVITIKRQSKIQIPKTP